MAKRANPGELRTKIEIKKKTVVTGANGYDIEKWVNVYGAGVYAWCKWVNAHGQEVFAAQQLGLEEVATLTMRYTPLLTAECEIYRYGDQKPFEVIGVDNVEQRNAWLEVKVKRKVAA